MAATLNLVLPKKVALILCVNYPILSPRKHVFATKIKSLRDLEIKLWNNLLIDGGHFEFNHWNILKLILMYASGSSDHETMLFATKIKSLRS